MASGEEGAGEGGGGGGAFEHGPVHLYGSRGRTVRRRIELGLCMGWGFGRKRRPVPRPIVCRPLH